MDVAQLIKDFGFPIVAAVGLGYFVCTMCGNGAPLWSSLLLAMRTKLLLH